MSSSICISYAKDDGTWALHLYLRTQWVNHVNFTATQNHKGGFMLFNSADQHA